MILTETALVALVAYLGALADGAEEPAPLIASVQRYHEDDLPDALEHLRTPPATIAIVVPGPERVDHTLLDAGDNTPLRADVTCEVNIFLAARPPAHGTGGSSALQPLKDAVLAALMWEGFGVPGLLCLPRAAEPVRLDYEDGHRVHAWRLQLELRTTIQPS